MADDIDEILARRRATKARKEAARIAEVARKEQMQKRQADANARWQEIEAELQAYIRGLNDRLRPEGLSLRYRAERKRTPSPVSDRTQAEVTLLEDDAETEKKLIINVSLDGFVRPVFLTPHTGPSSETLDVMETPSEAWPKLIHDFLNKAVE